MEAKPQGLSIARLTKRYGKVTAVDDVSLAVERGEFLTLLGPSGSGKTTILMAIAGFVEPSSGEIRMGDRTITHLPPEKRNFGMVFQGYALFPHMTVRENVGFPLKVRGTSRSEAAKQVDAVLDLVQLGRFGDRLPAQLSGGQQQRVALARALVFDPDILLLDEPLSALDKKLRAELQLELKAVHERIGKTFIAVTHDQDEALSMSDEVVILRHGRIVQKGTPAALYETPRTRFVAGFLGESNFLSGRISARDGRGFTFMSEGMSFIQAADEAPPEGTSILIGLRPEKLHIDGDAPPETTNRIEGRIANWTYYGANLSIVAETAVGRLAATLPSWRCRISPSVGSPVWLGWDPDASVMLLDDR